MDLSFSWNSPPLLGELEEKWNHTHQICLATSYSFRKQHFLYAETSLSCKFPCSGIGTGFFSSKNGLSDLKVFRSQVHGYSLIGEQTIGYPLLVGPLQYTPLFGFFFEELFWNRRNIEIKSPQVLLIPGKNVHLQSPLPFLGCQIFYEPWKTPSFFVSATYICRFGLCYLKTNYKQEDLFFQRQTEQFSVMQKGAIAAQFQWRGSTYLGFDISYAKQTANKQRKKQEAFLRLDKEEIQGMFVVLFLF